MKLSKIDKRMIEDQIKHIEHQAIEKFWRSIILQCIWGNGRTGKRAQIVNSMATKGDTLM